MRLTLRSLLAHQHRVLSQETSDDVSVRIDKCDIAKTVDQRLWQLKQHLDQCGDGIHDATDPNQISEYLDNQLPDSEVPAFESECLGGDLALLAELAACHEILSWVLSKPVHSSSQLHQRLYGLTARDQGTPAVDRLAGPESKNVKATSGPPADDDAPWLRPPPTTTLARGPSNAAPSRATSSAPLKQTQRVRIAALAGVAIAVAIGGWILIDPPDVKEVPGPAPAGDLASIHTPSSLNEGVPPSERERIASNDRPAAPSVTKPPAEDVPATDVLPTDKVAEPVRDQVEASVDAAANLDNRSNPAAPKPAPLDVANLTAPRTPASDSPTSQGDVAPLSPAPPTSPLTSVTTSHANPATIPTTSSPPTRVHSPPLAHVYASKPSVDPVGHLAPKSWRLILAPDGTWQRPASMAVYANQTMLVLPMQRVEWRTTDAWDVTVWGPAALTCVPSSTAPTGVRWAIDYGRFEWNTRSSQPLSLQIHGQDYEVSAKKPCRLEIWPHPEHGADPASAIPRSGPFVKLNSGKGSLKWRLPVSVLELRPGQSTTWVDGNLTAAPADEPLPPPPVDRLYASDWKSFLDSIPTEKPLHFDVAMLERTDRVGWLARNTLALTGEYAPLLRSLAVEGNQHFWPADVETLRLAIAWSSDSALAVEQAARDSFGPDVGKQLYRSLWGCEPSRFVLDGKELIDRLQHPQLCLRVVAFEMLRRQTHTTHLYRPVASPIQQAARIQAWRTRLESGKLKHHGLMFSEFE